MRRRMRVKNKKFQDLGRFRKFKSTSKIMGSDQEILDHEKTKRERKKLLFKWFETILYSLF
jgi:hypothetical protein